MDAATQQQHPDIGCLRLRGRYFRVVQHPDFRRYFCHGSGDDGIHHRRFHPHHPGIRDRGGGYPGRVRLGASVQCAAADHELPAGNPLDHRHCNHYRGRGGGLYTTDRHHRPPPPSPGITATHHRRTSHGALCHRCTGSDGDRVRHGAVHDRQPTALLAIAGRRHRQVVDHFGHPRPWHAQRRDWPHPVHGSHTGRSHGIDWRPDTAGYGIVRGLLRHAGHGRHDGGRAAGATGSAHGADGTYQESPHYSARHADHYHLEPGNQRSLWQEIFVPDHTQEPGPELPELTGYPGFTARVRRRHHGQEHPAHRTLPVA